MWTEIVRFLELVAASAFGLLLVVNIPLWIDGWKYHQRIRKSKKK